MVALSVQAPSGRVVKLCYEDICLVGEVTRNCCVNIGVDPDVHRLCLADGVSPVVPAAEQHTTSLREAGLATGAMVCVVPVISCGTGAVEGTAHEQDDE